MVRISLFITTLISLVLFCLSACEEPAPPAPPPPPPVIAQPTPTLDKLRALHAELLKAFSGRFMHANIHKALLHYERSAPHDEERLDSTALIAQRDLIRQVIDLSNAPPERWPSDPDDADAQVTPTFAIPSFHTRILLMDASLEFQANRPDGCAERLIAALRLAHTTYNQDDPRYTLRGLGLSVMIYEKVNMLLAEDAFRAISPAQRADLLNALALFEIDDPRALRAFLEPRMIALEARRFAEMSDAKGRKQFAEEIRSMPNYAALLAQMSDDRTPRLEKRFSLTIFRRDNAGYIESMDNNDLRKARKAATNARNEVLNAIAKGDVDSALDVAVQRADADKSEMVRDCLVTWISVTEYARVLSKKVRAIKSRLQPDAP